MTSPRSFDRLARIYQVLEFLAFGRDLEAARFAHLDCLRLCPRILIVGEGDGRCLVRLARLAPQAHLEVIDASAAMIARARRRLAAEAQDSDRIIFHLGDARTVDLPANSFDAVVTLFFLDCFSAPDAARVVDRLERALRPEAWWLWADFAVPAGGLARWRARAWLRLLYTFFHWQTGLQARELPPAEDLVADRGFTPSATGEWQAGLLRSVAWRRLAKTR